MLGGRYRVIDRVGAGGMADVFRAHDELLGRQVAVKVFRSAAVSDDTAAGAERQQIELHALARLNHPNLITLFDGSIVDPDGPPFLVMELINGPSLAARIADGPVPEPQVREVGIQIADALAYVHAEGMVHRDVKPANILLGTDSTAGDGTVRARLSDFGIVRLVGSERLTSVDFTLGTASYLAPEQARGADVGPVADVYSLGLALIESHTGVRTYGGPPLEAVRARLERSPDVPRHLPAPWPALLGAMTALDAAERPTAAQVAETLRDGRTRTAPLPLAAGLAGPANALGLANAAGAAAPAAGATGAADDHAGAGAAAGLAAVGAAAGLAAARGFGGPAAADAETVGLAALGAPALAPPPEVADPWEPPDAPRRWRAVWLLAAAAIVAAIAVGTLALLRPTPHHQSPADKVPVSPQLTRPAATHARTSGAASASTSAASATGTPTTSVAAGSTAAAGGTVPSTVPSTAPSTSPAASTSAVTTTSAPASSSPPASGATAPPAPTSSPSAP